MDALQTLQLQLTSGLFPAARQWQRLADVHLGGYGVSSGCVGPLLTIGRAGGGIRQVAVAQALGMEGPSLVRLLDKLCSTGLVRRESDTADRRANQLWLTDEGQTLFVALETDLLALRKDIFAALPPQDIEAALRVHAVLAEATTRLP